MFLWILQSSVIKEVEAGIEALVSMLLDRGELQMPPSQRSRFRAEIRQEIQSLVQKRPLWATARAFAVYYSVRFADLSSKSALIGHKSLLDLLESRSATPWQIARELGDNLSAVRYRLKSLTDSGIIEVASTECRRGAVENLYRRRAA